jgi:septum formation protein
MSDASRIVLASASPRRRRMFEEIAIPFEIVPADIDESMLPGEEPAEAALRVAGEKGLSVATALARSGRTPWIVAADTIVVLDDDVLTKPVDADDAARMLGMLSGREHTVITGWVVGRHQGPWTARTTATRVFFHALTDAQIRGYAASGDGLDKAGAYAIQGLGAFLVERIDGDYFNVVGLPISLVVRALIDAGALPGFLAP